MSRSEGLWHRQEGQSVHSIADMLRKFQRTPVSANTIVPRRTIFANPTLSRSATQSDCLDSQSNCSTWNNFDTRH
jgi:hypothetical protein